MATWTIIGAGRIGNALAERSRQKQRDVQVLTRQDDWQVLAKAGKAPILVCTRNDDLDNVLQRVPKSRHHDLVFIQNGMIRPWLARHALHEATRGLLFFAVQTRGAPIDTGPPSPFHGRHAAAVVAELRALDIPAEEVSATDFAQWELEKLLWNCVFGLLCTAYDMTVGQVLEAHREEVVELATELLDVGQSALMADAPMDKGAVLTRLLQYSLAIPHNRAAIREWTWRNGWFVSEASRQGRPLPLHTRLCASVDL